MSRLKTLRYAHRSVCIGVTIVTSGCFGSLDKQQMNASDPRRARLEKRREQLRMQALKQSQSETTADASDESPVNVLLINGDPLSVEDVLKWIRPELDRLADELPPDEYQVQMIELLQQELRERAESQLLYQVADRHLRPQERQRVEKFVDDRIQEIVTREHGGRQSRYEQHLRQQGIDPAEDRERIRREMLVLAYLQKEIRPKVADPTRREIQQYYDEYCAEIQAAQKRSMGLIEIPIGDTDAVGYPLDEPLTAQQAYQRCRQAQAEINSGAPFGQVARKYSLGINAANGGNWGLVTRDGVRARWEPAVDALYRLNEGQTSSVIETPEACFLVKCTSIERPERKSFIELQKVLIERFRNHQFELEARELIAELYENADIQPQDPSRFLRALAMAASDEAELSLATR